MHSLSVSPTDQTPLTQTHTYTHADDPFWWHATQIEMLRGTRLGRAVTSSSTNNSGSGGIAAIMQLARRLQDMLRCVFLCVLWIP